MKKTCITLKTIIITLIIPALMFVFPGCTKESTKSEVLLSKVEKDAQKQRVIEVIDNYLEGANNRDWNKMVSTLANEVMFFGTDRGEASRNFNEFKATMLKQWDEYETLIYCPIDTTAVFVTIDDYARYANVIFGANVIVGKKGQAPDTLYTVTQRTLKRDITRDQWLIESGILSISR